MNKKKTTLGIVIAILGGIICITSLIFGIIHIAGELYEDVNTFPLRISDSQEPLKEAFRTDNFRVNSQEPISIWLKIPDRKIENKDFLIIGSFREQSGNVIADFEENFNFGYIRNSYGQDQYYKLGKHHFSADLDVYLSYTTSGTWTLPYEGSLVIRQKKPFSIPLKEIVFFILGIIILITGYWNNNQKQIR